MIPQHIYIYDAEAKLIAEYRTMSELNKELGVSISGVIKAMKTNRSYKGKWYFSRTAPDTIKQSDIPAFHTYDLKGNLIISSFSRSEIADKLGLRKEYITRHIANKTVFEGKYFVCKVAPQDIDVEKYLIDIGYFKYKLINQIESTKDNSKVAGLYNSFSDIAQTLNVTRQRVTEAYHTKGIIAEKFVVHKI